METAGEVKRYICMRFFFLLISLLPVRLPHTPIASSHYICVRLQALLSYNITNELHYLDQKPPFNLLP